MDAALHSLVATRPLPEAAVPIGSQLA